MLGLLGEQLLHRDVKTQNENGHHEFVSKIWEMQDFIFFSTSLDRADRIECINVVFGITESDP